MKREPKEVQKSSETHALNLQAVARLRIIVGFLGEKGQYNWWASEFFSVTATAFLSPVFGKTASLAQYHGVREAACRVHDEHIGIGRVFHLFRLPDSVEQAVFDQLQTPAVMDALRRETESHDQAIAALTTLADSTNSLREGPVQIGTVPDLESTHWLSDAAGCYKAAFNAGSLSFPYLVDGV